MNKWVLLEHKVYSDNSLDIHYDFLIENGIDCLTWKFLKIPLLNQASIEIFKQPNHRLCLLYTSPSPRDNPASRMPSSA